MAIQENILDILFFYKPTLLYVLEDTNGDGLEVARITNISIKNDIFAFTMTFLINDRDEAYPHNIAKTDILPIDNDFDKMGQTLKFIDDNVDIKELLGR